MQELEEDPDMRQRVDLYRDPQALQRLQQQQQQAAAPSGLGSEVGEEDDEDGEGLPQVPLEELLDDLEALTLEQGGYDTGEGPGGDGGASNLDDDAMSE